MREALPVFGTQPVYRSPLNQSDSSRQVAVYCARVDLVLILPLSLSEREHQVTHARGRKRSCLARRTKEVGSQPKHRN